MRLMDRVYLVGSGEFGLSHDFDCNIYVIDEGNGLIMVDSGAGFGVDEVMDNLSRDGLTKPIRWLLLTHAHADHAGGAHAFRQRFQCMVIAGEPEAAVIERGEEKELGLDVAKRSGFYSPDYVFSPCKIDLPVSHGDVLQLGSLSVTALNVRGHSPGSICYFCEIAGNKVLFTGDVVFAKGVIGLLNYEGSSLSEYRQYLPLLRGLGVDVLLPGHGIFVLTKGQRHIDLACARLERLQIPPNFI